MRGRCFYFELSPGERGFGFVLEETAMKGKLEKKREEVTDSLEQGFCMGFEEVKRGRFGRSIFFF